MGKKRQTEQSKREADLEWRLEQLKLMVRRLLILIRMHYPDTYTFTQRGNVWVIRFQDEMGFFSDLKGFQHLHRLLSNPGRRIPATSLVAWTTTSKGGDRFSTVDEMNDRLVSGQERPLAGGRVVVPAGRSGFDGSNYQPICDPLASTEIGERIRSLREEMERAEAAGAEAKYQQMQDELTALQKQRRKDTFQGRSRSFTNAEKKAAQNVHHRLRDAYQAMAEGNPPMKELVKYLRNSIFCESNQYIYRPIAPLHWAL